MSATTKPRIAVVGSNMVDLITYVSRMPGKGETIEAPSFEMGHGGKGANQAVAAARAGAQVQFVGAVGDDPAAAQLREHLNTNRVGTDGLITLSGPSGNAVVIVDSSGENIIVVAPGANGQLTLDSASLRSLVASKYDVVARGGHADEARRLLGTVTSAG